MTAWELLTANSSLSDGTAWAHLNSQEGVNSLVVYEYMGAELMPDIQSELEAGEIAAEIEQNDLASDIEPDIGSELE